MRCVIGRYAPAITQELATVEYASSPVGEAQCGGLDDFSADHTAASDGVSADLISHRASQDRTRRSWCSPSHQEVLGLDSAKVQDFPEAPSQVFEGLITAYSCCGW